MIFHRPLAVARQDAHQVGRRVGKRVPTLGLIWLALASVLHAQQTSDGKQSWQLSSSKSLTTIPPGTLVNDGEAATWNRAVLLATPRIASGDTEKLSASVRSSVSRLTLTILATVKSEANDSGSSAYRLQDIGLAYAALVQGKLKTVTTASASRLGAQLDFYSRQMLSENEKQIAGVKLVVRTSTLAMFDAPTILFRDGQHKDFTTRHLVWIDARTGKMSIVLWLLNTDRDGRAQVADETLRLVAPGTTEDRRIHIDGRSFFLGIPSARAFALEDLPPGRDFTWNDQAKLFASASSYDQQSLRDFAVLLNELLSSSTSNRNAR